VAGTKPPRKTASLRLTELSSLKLALTEAARVAARRDAEHKATVAAQRLERDLFARTVGAVHALKPTGHATIYRARPPALPLQRQLDEQAALVEALSDEFDVESLLETDEALSFRRRGITQHVVTRLRRGDWHIQDQIDLHGLRRDEAREELSAFLRQSSRMGVRCVRVVHGKGHGSPGREPVLKQKVRGWLVQHNSVLAFVQARPVDGGSGAVVVLLDSSSPPTAGS
jgi:DNA-nicking Smr family endonuclease